MATPDFKARQQIRDFVDFGLGQLTPGAVGASQQALFAQLMQQQGGFLNSLVNQQGLAGQMAGQSTIANLSRMGLGNTGLGAALSGALQRGSAFQGNALRQRLMSELAGQSMNSAMGLAQLRAGLIGSALGPTAASVAGAEKPWWQTGIEGAAGAGSAYLGRPPA